VMLVKKGELKALVLPEYSPAISTCPV
jgi:hypothetical protein